MDERKRPILWFSVCKRLAKKYRWWVRRVNGNIPLTYKAEGGKHDVTKYMKDDVDKLPDSDISKSANRVLEK